ncbi:hypothetical protein FWG95_04560 [Candidatus Saccharibacteria bacterium]|nr:hypothetical protein [Candidatus Saccharibacteria bacterium]
MRGLFGSTKKSTFLKVTFAAIFAFATVLAPWSSTMAYATTEDLTSDSVITSDVSSVEVTTTPVNEPVQTVFENIQATAADGITFTFGDEEWDATGWGNSAGKSCPEITSNSNGKTLLVAGGPTEAFEIWISTSNHNEWKIEATGDIPAAGVEFQIYYQYVPEGQTNTEIFTKTVFVEGSGTGSVAIVAGVTGVNSDSINEVHTCSAKVVPPTVNPGTIVINKVVNDEVTGKFALPTDADSVKFEFEVTINGANGSDYAGTYSFDGGNTWIDYTGPFTVEVSANQPVEITVPDSSKIDTIQVREIDDLTDVYVFGDVNDLTYTWDNNYTMTFDFVNIYSPEICWFDDSLLANDPDCVGGSGGGEIEVTPPIVMTLPSTGFMFTPESVESALNLNWAILALGTVVTALFGARKIAKSQA